MKTCLAFVFVLANFILISVTEAKSPKIVKIPILEGDFAPQPNNKKFWTHLPSNKPSLSNQRLTDIKEVPPFTGQTQFWGQWKLGVEGRIFKFVFDMPKKGHPTLYFDRNANSNLVDDGGPITNQGTGPFAASVDIPANIVIPESNWGEAFNLWIFVSDFETGIVNRYCRVPLVGKIKLGGTIYMAVIADSKDNDLDFTNDGIYVDINNDAVFDKVKEYFPSDKIVSIGENEYVLRPVLKLSFKEKVFDFLGI